MKKRIFAAFAAGIAATCCLAACGKTVDASGYEMLNEMAGMNYSQIVLTVTNTFDESTFLKSEYVIDYGADAVTVEYSVERFNTVDSLLPDVKTTLSGTVVIEGDKITVEGDNVGLTASIATLGLTFEADHFKDAELSDMFFKASVENPSAFLGTPIFCTDMKVEATFLEAFYNIRITYTAESGSRAEYKYVFNL